jgi:Fe-S oxidoreductase
MTYGDLAATQAMAEKNLALLAQREFDVIVTDCSSCASFLKKYPTLFPEGDPRREAAEVQAGRVRDIVQLLPQAPPLPTVQPGEKVIATYHDPLPCRPGAENLPRAARHSPFAARHRVPRIARSGLVLRRSRFLCRLSL